MQNAIPDVVDEGKVGTVAGPGRTVEGEVDPIRPVDCHLMAAYLEDGEFSDETDHDRIIP